MWTIYQNISFLGACCVLNYGLGKLVYNLIPCRYNKFNTLTNDKKLYVVKNLTKSAVLLSILYRIFLICINLYRHSTNMNNEVKAIASIYVSNDIIGLITVPNLPSTTVKHHLTTTFLLFVNYYIDYDNIDLVSTKIGYLLVGYSAFSAMSFFVNFYLGYRHLTENKQQLDNVRQVALINYSVCIFINWISQILFMAHTTTRDYSLLLPYSLYGIFLIPIIKDDLILVSWLQK